MINAVRMIKYIETKKEFDNQTVELLKIFKANTSFQNNIFTQDYGNFLFFEFDYIYTNDYFHGIQSLINETEGKCFTFYTLSPDPEKYFHENFNKYSVSIISQEDSYKNYVDFLHRSPGNVADSLINNAETIAFFSAQSLWGVVASKEWEIGVVGFRNSYIKRLFTHIFRNDVGPGKIFDTLDSYISEYDSMFNWSEKTRQNWFNLKLSYLG